MRKIIFGISLFFFSIVNTYSQDTLLSWKKIPESDLKMITYDQDPGADAVILQEYVEISFKVWQDELRLYYDVYQRIKILTEEGKKYATIEIPYIGFEDYEDVSFLSGYTYNFENGVIKKKKLKLKSVEKIDSNKIVFTKKFTMPDVQVGSVIEYKYSIASLNFIEPETFYFQKEIPVRYSEFRANIPDFMTYKINITGYENLQTAEQEESNIGISWIYKHNDPIPSGSAYTSRDYTVPINFKFDSYYTRYTMSNIPAYQQENYTDSYLNYIYSVKLNLTKVTQDIGYYSYIYQLAWKDLTKRLYLTTENSYILTKSTSNFKTYPAGYILYNTKTWEDFSTQMQNDENYGLQLVKSFKFRTVLNKIYSEDSTEITNIKNIYNFVRDSINWNGDYYLFLSKTIEEVLNQKSGNSTEINFLLISLLRKADFEANPVIIKTRTEGKPDVDLPSFYQFNHTIVAVEIEGETILLDATEKNKPFNLLSIEDLNQSGLLLKSINSEWIDIENYQKSKVEYTDSIIFEDNAFIVKKQINDFGYYAYNKRLDKTNPMYLFTNIENPIYPDFENINKENFEKELITKYSVKTDKIFDEDKNSITIYPFETYTNLQNPFSDFQRNNPVNFGYPFEENYKLYFQIPDGYSVKDFSKPENFIVGNDDASLIFNSKITENLFEYNISLKINSTEFPVSQYFKLRELFEKYVEMKKMYIYVEKK